MGRDGPTRIPIALVRQFMNLGSDRTSAPIQRLTRRRRREIASRMQSSGTIMTFESSTCLVAPIARVVKPLTSSAPCDWPESEIARVLITELGDRKLVPFWLSDVSGLLRRLSLRPGRRLTDECVERVGANMRKVGVRHTLDREGGVLWAERIKHCSTSTESKTFTNHAATGGAVSQLRFHVGG